MNKADPDTRGNSAEDSSLATNGGSGDERPLPWLLRQKIAVPQRVEGYLERTELLERAMPVQRRLTVLQAPGGFGKTTVLAECCRRIHADGVPVAWVSVGEQDEPDALDTYIAYACRSAAGSGRAGVENRTRSCPGEAGAGCETRTERAVREIARLVGPFVLVFDELAWLKSPETDTLLEFLVQRGPPNLHLAFSCRTLPAGFNIAALVFEGRAIILSADDLRFSRTEVADFFEGKLTRAQLATVMSESAGWPLALRVSRNEIGSGEPRGSHASHDLVENWVESRLFHGLEAEDRKFLLDIGLFEWMDAALVDEVFERSDSMQRIDALSALAGLLEPVRDGESDVWRLHPFVRDHCARRRFQETPERYETIHRRISRALEHRGQTVAAMRHAAQAGEPALAADILERAGGVRLWLREGRVQLQAAERQLNEDTIEARPRLGLIRCLSLIESGRMEEAKERHRALAPLLDGLEADESEAGFALAVDNFMVRGMIALFGAERFSSELVQTQLADTARLAKSPRIDLLTRGLVEYNLCMANAMTAQFSAATRHASRARHCFAHSPHMTMYVDMQAGQIAMAMGEVHDAAVLYRSAERVAKASYVLEATPPAACSILMHELALERYGAASGADHAGVPKSLVTGSTPVQAYAAASGAVVDFVLRDKGVERALEAADEMLDYVRTARLSALVRFVSGLRVSLLAIAGRTDDGERAWASDELPADDSACLDLSGQTWREMEALSCARLRLAIARERFDEGRSFAGELRSVAAGRGLRRTLMRALALSVVLEHRAGDAAAACGHLEEYLLSYARTPYAGPLMRERADCAKLVAAFGESAPESPVKETARSLLAAMEWADDPGQPVLREREREVLQGLGKKQDKQIAAELGLSAHGVRHHIRKLFTKLGARNRAEAVSRARGMGLICDEN